MHTRARLLVRIRNHFEEAGLKGFCLPVTSKPESARKKQLIVETVCSLTVWCLRRREPTHREITRSDLHAYAGVRRGWEHLQRREGKRRDRVDKKAGDPLDRRSIR